VPAPPPCGHSPCSGGAQAASGGLIPPELEGHARELQSLRRLAVLLRTLTQRALRSRTARQGRLRASPELDALCCCGAAVWRDVPALPPLDVAAARVIRLPSGGLALRQALRQEVVRWVAARRGLAWRRRAVLALLLQSPLRTVLAGRYLDHLGHVCGATAATPLQRAEIRLQGRSLLRPFRTPVCSCRWCWPAMLTEACRDWLVLSPAAAPATARVPCWICFLCLPFKRSRWRGR